MSTGFETLASAGSAARSAAVRVVAERRQLQAGGVARIRAEDPEPARVRQDRYAAGPSRRACPGEKHRRVDQLLEGGFADHPRLL